MVSFLWSQVGIVSHGLQTNSGSRLRFVNPVLLPGKEGLKGWGLAIGTIPKRLKTSVKAMVSDGWRGVEGLAKKYKWLLQRCHFHFIAQLQVNRGRWKHLPDQKYREAIYQTARKLLTTKRQVKFYKERLQYLTEQPTCPRRLQIIIHDFIRRLKNFRLCLNHPELNLPATTNSMESMNQLIRQQCGRLRTPKALQLWAILTVRLHPKIKCNKTNYQQN